jgi:hypothetical protein
VIYSSRSDTTLTWYEPLCLLGDLLFKPTYSCHLQDVLPWASFRQKALEAIRQEPPLLDEDELCRDICTGGLICWGAQQNSMGMEAGVPWDMRSWEAAVWFMNKYSFLVGDWNGEMWRGVRWWHNVRGERLVT